MTNPLRRPLIAGNWKMNLGLKEAAALLQALKAGLDGQEAAEIAVFPPFTALAVAAEALRGSRIGLGGQNMFWEPKGAFTGEISPVQLKDAGCALVLLGHSERRQHFGETDENLRKKIQAAVAHGLVPVLCVGETLEEREGGRTWVVLERQISGALAGLAPAQLSTLVIAYEPVWAIGTGRTATPQQAEEAHRFIRGKLASLFDQGLAQSRRILYGGSVTPENVDALMAEPDIDGALVGGASLKAEGFLRIIHYRVPAGR